MNHIFTAMDISIRKQRETDCACDALILPFVENERERYADLHPSLAALIGRVFGREFRAQKNESLLVPAPPEIKPQRIFFIGLGKKGDLSPERVRQAGGKSGTSLREVRMNDIALSTTLLRAHGLSEADFLEGLLLGTYRFRKYASEKKTSEIARCTVLAQPSTDLRTKVNWIRTLSSSVHFARDLVNTPANDMTPSDLARAACSLRTSRLRVTILDEKDAKGLGMGSYLSVARGSDQPPRFIILEYRGSKGKPIVLIGKSVTFDSGGISLKPADGMEKMKYDMAGGAAVLGVMRAISLAQLPVHVIGILPATENLPGGSASRPGDVVRSLNGKTIEIISTDAEGRMTIADAIAFALRYKPRAIIDIATLTGACAIAFGHCAIAMMGNRRELLDAVKRAGEQTQETVWEMPLAEDCAEYLKSDVADLKNTGGKSGALLTSAYFLSQFVGDTPWVHLDIAGTAWAERERPYIPKGASGIGVRLLATLVRDFAR